MERLAWAEKLLVELKEMIREKDIQLQQKDEALQVPWFIYAEHLLNTTYLPISEIG